MRTEDKAKAISELIQEWLFNNKRVEVTPAEISGYLAEKGIFKRDDGGKSLRGFLRKLRDEKKLSLIKGLEEIPKIRNSNWVIRKV